MMRFNNWCWICIDNGVDSHIPHSDGMAVNCKYCGNSFCGFKHLMAHICNPRQKEEDLTIEDIFREINGNPDWGNQPAKLEVYMGGKKMEADK